MWCSKTTHETNHNKVRRQGQGLFSTVDVAQEKCTVEITFYPPCSIHNSVANGLINKPHSVAIQ